MHPERDENGRDDRDGDDQVVASLDRSDGEPTFVIANVSTDGAWLATPTAETVGLVANR